MKRVIEILKKKYKILIPLMVVSVLLATVYFLYKEYKFDNYRNKQEISVFQYFGGYKREYTAVVTYNLKNVIVDMYGKDLKVEYDSKPVYYVEEDKVIFPKEMSAVFPYKNGRQYRLYKYSIYEKIGNVHKLSNGNKSGDYDTFFLFDGEDLYFFPDEVVLNIDGKEYKRLGSMSYAMLVGNETLVYYDHESDTSEVIELENSTATITSEYINVDLNGDSCLAFEHKILLLKPDMLKPLLTN